MALEENMNWLKKITQIKPSNKTPFLNWIMYEAVNVFHLDDIRKKRENI